MFDDCKQITVIEILIKIVFEINTKAAIFMSIVIEMAFDFSDRVMSITGSVCTNRQPTTLPLPCGTMVIRRTGSLETGGTQNIELTLHVYVTSTTNSKTKRATMSCSTLARNAQVTLLFIMSRK